MYRELAEALTPSTLTALSEARRLLEHDRAAGQQRTALSSS
jgi:hypothetical protein